MRNLDPGAYPCLIDEPGATDEADRVLGELLEQQGLAELVDVHFFAECNHEGTDREVWLDLTMREPADT